MGTEAARVFNKLARQILQDQRRLAVWESLLIMGWRNLPIHFNITDPWNGGVHASLKVSNQNSTELSTVQTYKSLKHVIYFETTICQIHRQFIGRKLQVLFFHWPKAKNLKSLMI